HWKTAADLISDWLANCAFDTNEVQREKGVIVQEIKMGEEEPGRAMWKLFQETLFLKNEARVPIIGYEEDFIGVTRNEIIDYYSRRYVANNMIIVIVGDVYRSELDDVLKSTFAKVKRGRDMQWLLTPEPKMISSRKAVKRFNVQKAHVEIGFPSIKLNEPDLYSLDLFAKVAASGNSSPLVKKIKDEKQLVYSISAGSWTPSYVRGVFTISFTCDETNVNKAVEAILAELESMKNNPFDNKDIERARRQILVSHFSSLQTVGSIAGEIGGNMISLGDPNFGVKYISELQKVTKDDLMRVANKYFDTNTMLFVALLPKKNEVNEISKNKIVKAENTFNFKKHKLNNGITVVTRANNSVPLVAFSLCLQGGLAYETKDNNGISALMAGMLTKGTPSRSADEIAQTIERLGASLSYGANRDSISGSARCLPVDVPTIIDLLSDTLLNASFPKDELEKKKRLTLSAIAAQKESWSREGFNNFTEMFFENSPFAMQTIGSTGAVTRLDVDELKKYHAKILQPSSIVIAVAGDFDENKIIKLLNEKIGGFNSLASPMPKPTDINSIANNHIIKKPSPRSQATVVLGLQAPNALSPERYPFLVLQKYIGGFGGPLFRALRGENDLVYATFAFPVLEPEAGALVMMAQCYPENADKVFEQMTNVAATVSIIPLSEKLLMLAKNATLIPYQLDRQTIQSIVNSAAVWEYRGKGANFGKEFAGKINEVTSNDVLDFAKKYFDKWTCVMTVPE
ncbi:insulinase family protein, partial [bacterium]|nr:insulinase family protein [bacterium]